MKPDLDPDALAAQTIDWTTSCYADARDYSKDLERRGFSVKFTNTLTGSNYWWRVQAEKPTGLVTLRPLTPEDAKAGIKGDGK